MYSRFYHISLHLVGNVDELGVLVPPRGQFSLTSYCHVMKRLKCSRMKEHVRVVMTANDAGNAVLVHSPGGFRCLLLELGTSGSASNSC